MQYVFERDLRSIIVYFQSVPQSGVTLNTLGPESKPVILFSHGNADDIGAYFNYCRDLATSTKCHVLTYDYYNYGLSSTASTSEDMLLEASEAVFKFLKSKNVQIIVYGKSIGTVPSIFLAADSNVIGLVLVSPLASGVRCLNISHFMTKKMLNSFDSFFGDSISRIKKVKCPVIFFHGLQDTVIHCENTSILYSELCKSPFQAHNESELPHFFGTYKNPGTHQNLETTFRSEFFSCLTRFVNRIISQKNN